MAAVRSISTFVNSWPTTATSTTFTAPAGIQDGDILVIFLTVGVSWSAPAIDTPAGFTLATGFSVEVNASDYYLNHACFYKVASGESGNYTVTHSDGTNGGIMYAVSGANTTTPLSPNPSITTGTTSEGASLAVTGLTTANDNDLVLGYWATWDDAGPASPPSGYTEHLDSSIHYSCSQVYSSAGATGTVTLTSANSAHTIWMGTLVAIQDAGGGGSSGDLLLLTNNSAGF